MIEITRNKKTGKIDVLIEYDVNKRIRIMNIDSFKEALLCVASYSRKGDILCIEKDLMKDIKQTVS